MNKICGSHNLHKDSERWAGGWLMKIPRCATEIVVSPLPVATISFRNQPWRESGGFHLHLAWVWRFLGDRSKHTCQLFALVHAPLPYHCHQQSSVQSSKRPFKRDNSFESEFRITTRNYYNSIILERNWCRSIDVLFQYWGILSSKKILCTVPK